MRICLTPQNGHQAGNTSRRTFSADCYDGFPKNQLFFLERSVSQKTRAQIRGVKAIHLSAPLEYKREVREGTDTGYTTLPIGNRWEALKAFLGEKLDITQLSTQGFIEPKDIDVTLSLSWKKHRGDTVSDQIDSMANTFRHVDDDIDFELETLSGKIKKDQLRMSRPFSVRHNDDMPERDDIFDKMIQWYEHLVEANDI
jgi:hypothetical protein